METREVKSGYIVAKSYIFVFKGSHIDDKKLLLEEPPRYRTIASCGYTHFL